MAFLDNLKSTLIKKGKSHLTLNVCMLGARGVGKTSVVTAIFDDARSKDGFNGTKVYMKATPETEVVLSRQRRLLWDVFDNRTDIAAIPASKDESVFNFQIGLVENPPCIDLIISDYPGEWLKSEPQYVSDKIMASEVVIIAIDSPYLMENNGEYCEEKNQIALTTKFIKENIESFKDKLVMLVPLKCEAYFGFSTDGRRNDRSSLLTAKVLHAYSELIEILKNNGDVAVMVAPILTVGGVVFSEFENRDGIHVAKYKFNDTIDMNGKRINAAYKPRFCTQPIYHLLSFVAYKYMRYRKRAGILDSLFQRLADFFVNNNEFLLEIEKINEKRIKDGNGYKIICGQDLFFTKNR